MMKDLRLGFKLMKYSFKFKQNVYYLAFFCVMGILFFFLGEMGLFGPLYLSMTGLMLVQVINTLQFSHMVQSSPNLRALQVWIPTAFSLISSLIMYGVSIFILILIHGTGGQIAYGFGSLILFGTMAMVMMGYGVLLQKMGGIAMTVYLFVGIGIFVAVMVTARQVLEELSLGMAAGISLAEILLGTCLQYLAARLTYRLPVRNKAMLETLQKYK